MDESVAMLKKVNFSSFCIVRGNMLLKEYEGKELLSKYGIASPIGFHAMNVDELVTAFQNIGSDAVIKPIGMKKRGKMGYIIFAKTSDEARAAGEKLFSIDGIKELIIEQKLDVENEVYVGIILDYSKRLPVLVLSSQGGVDIEEMADASPGKIKRVYISVLDGIDKQSLHSAVDSLRIDFDYSEEIERIALQLCKMFIENDAELLELNPLAITEDGRVAALDCLLAISDDALYRHPEFSALANERRTGTELEKQAAELGWSYLDMDGNIGILSSGAGITMAILDLLKLHGGKPANFLDTAQMGTEEVYKAFELMAKNKNAKVIFVNIFAGLNRCDLLAEGIKKYILEKKPSVPVIVRMIGNMEDEGFAILRSIGIEPIKELEPAVIKAVEIAQG